MGAKEEQVVHGKDTEFEGGLQIWGTSPAMGNNSGRYALHEVHQRNGKSSRMSNVKSQNYVEGQIIDWTVVLSMVDTAQQYNCFC